MIYCSGNIGINPDTKSLVEGSITDRTEQALTNLKHILNAAGSSLENVVKVNIFITTMDNFAKMNEAWDEFFTAEVKPVSDMVLCRALSRSGVGTGRPSVS